MEANAPHSGAVETIKSHRVRVVSDSSDDMWGYLIFTELGLKDSEHGHKWTKSLGDASDPASRGLGPASKELVKECFRVMLAQEKGHIKDQRTVGVQPDHSRRRHSAS